MKAPCGHTWCTWRWRLPLALAAVIYAAFTGWTLQPSAAPTWAATGAAAAAILLALVFWPRPCPGHDIEAIIRAVREERLPSEWTDGDWADLDKELSQ